MGLTFTGLFTIFKSVNFAKTTIHFQNSTRSITVHLPEILFRASTWIKVIVLVGVVLFAIQLVTISLYDGLLSQGLSSRRGLDRDLTKIQETVDYLSMTSDDFYRDERRLHARYGLPLPDEATREMGTGGEIASDSLLLRGMSPVLEKAAVLQEETDRLKSKFYNNGESFSSLTHYINQRQAIWRFVPSICPTQGHYASSFGPRIHPVTGEVGKMHNGIDIGNDRWTPIFASADGVVEIAKLSPSFGNYVMLDHSNGLKTVYAHMQMYVVKPGEFVRRYQLIGYMGNTGLSVGPHLHYEVWENNHPVNPLAYILPNDHSVE